VYLYPAVFTPDGSAIVFPANWGLRCYLFRVDIATGATRRVTSAQGGCELSPTFSPDGQHLAFLRRTTIHDEHSYVIGANADGTDERILVTDQSYNSLPQFASPLNEVLYLRRPKAEAHNYKVYAVYLPTREIVRLTDQSYYNIFAMSVSPDGHQMMLSVNDSEGEGFLVSAIDSADKPIMRLRPEPFDYVTLATWLPDGRSILFAGGVRHPGTATHDYNVYRMTIAGGAIVPLTTFTGSFNGLHVSPDGTKAVVLYETAYWVIDLATHQLTKVPLNISRLKF